MVFKTCCFNLGTLSAVKPSHQSPTWVVKSFVLHNPTNAYPFICTRKHDNIVIHKTNPVMMISEKLTKVLLSNTELSSLYGF